MKLSNPIIFSLFSNENKLKQILHCVASFARPVWTIFEAYKNSRFQILISKCMCVCGFGHVISNKSSLGNRSIWESVAKSDGFWKSRVGKVFFEGWSRQPTNSFWKALTITILWNLSSRLKSHVILYAFLKEYFFKKK